MKRYFFKISYDGTSYFGWQKQPKQVSIQETIEKDLSKIHSLKEMSIVGCGRTDAGVHAKEYYFHWECEKAINESDIKYKMNKMLPSGICIQDVFEVSGETHARFSAKERSYEYLINTSKNPFAANHSWYIHQKLDLDKMNDAASLLIGTKDFTSFAKIHTDVNNHICQLNYAKWVQKGNQITFEIRANRFLRNMVRAIVGTCVDVGLNKIQLEEFKRIIEAKNRQQASGSAPAKGLYLNKVTYDLELKN
ncbi:tRNA pseudouridine(38-40) synthase TruA [Crocinitomicaceae bacterium]|jgi:tRNA pseudouridine38-40 synthase|nr:tRNA pseudouridine(38-40) synthase TruA [Flavobacteriales bacterium]MDC0272300.1 tRNA pseudouridine(38-40) synthase TruA [Crocinitomicaceae bacterium]MDC0459523.1 tRNA pseudouridine(38-40) synthase TruA [Crocinitomicaceae bacterium]MDO7609611.1 tRNA pseudouridine(38-40) synthase TruA [Crocinitomicaceae bacterium]